MKKTRVIILFGGRSAEHEVSLLSARNVFLALDRERFEPVLIGIDKQGRWHLEPERTLLGADRRSARAARCGRPAPSWPCRCTRRAASVERPRGARPLLAGDDVVFPVLHGTYGEDGTVQGLLELADVAYVGAGRARLGDRAWTRTSPSACCADAGIPVVPWRWSPRTACARDPAAALAARRELGFPAVRQAGQRRLVGRA